MASAQVCLSVCLSSSRFPKNNNPVGWPSSHAARFRGSRGATCVKDDSRFRLCLKRRRRRRNKNWACLPSTCSTKLKHTRSDTLEIWLLLSFCLFFFPSSSQSCITLCWSTACMVGAKHLFFFSPPVPLKGLCVVGAPLQSQCGCDLGRRCPASVKSSQQEMGEDSFRWLDHFFLLLGFSLSITWRSGNASRGSRQ